MVYMYMYIRLCKLCGIHSFTQGAAASTSPLIDSISGGAENHRVYTQLELLVGGCGLCPLCYVCTLCMYLTVKFSSQTLAISESLAADYYNKWYNHCVCLQVTHS